MQLFVHQHASSSVVRFARAIARGVGTAAIGASMLVASQAFASGTEQLKAFVAQVQIGRAHV